MIMGPSAFAFFALLVLGSQAAEKKPPTVKFEDCSDLELVGFDKCMTVIFHDNMVDEADKVGLNYLNQNENNMKGKLLSEQNSRVSVTVNGTMAFIIISARGLLHKFTFDKRTGESEFDGIKPGQNVTFLPPPTAPGSSAGNKDSDRGIETRALPTQGFLMKVWVLYDNAFSSRFGSGAESKIDELFNHVETFFSHASLGTSITPVELGKSQVSETWTATGGNIGSLHNYVQSSSLPDANAYVLLSYENNAGGVVGIAYLGTTCNRKGLRVGINEYLRDDIITAEIIVHEIGHNLGMEHDFVQSNGADKFASDGTPCTGINGYMDYGSNPNKWSRCSVEDFEAYYQGNQPFCMDLNTGTTPSTTSAPTSTVTANSPSSSSTTSAPTSTVTATSPSSSNPTASTVSPVTSTTETSSTGDPGVPCENTWQNFVCHRFRRYCSSIDCVSENCNKTCSVCGNGCYNIWRDSSCIARADRCDETGRRGRIMRSRCKETCGLC